MQYTCKTHKKSKTCLTGLSNSGHFFEPQHLPIGTFLPLNSGRVRYSEILPYSSSRREFYVFCFIKLPTKQYQIKRVQQLHRFDLSPFRLILFFKDYTVALKAFFSDDFYHPFISYFCEGNFSSFFKNTYECSLYNLHLYK